MKVLSVVMKGLIGLLRLAVPIAVLVGGVLGARWLIEQKDEVGKTAPERRETLVSVMKAAPSSQPRIVSAYGTVEAHRQVDIIPQVTGRIVEVHPRLVVGGLISEGENLLTIDDRDYVFAVEAQRAALVRAQFELDVERGRRVVAQREWKLLESSVDTTEAGRALALREPHLREKEAAVKAAESRLADIELDLERTRIPAPFNSVVASESVEVGQVALAPFGAQNMARLVCTDEFRVRVSIPIEDLGAIELPGSGRTPSRVTVSQELGGGRTARFEGTIDRLLADVDPDGRMARLLIRVPDPLRLASGGNGTPLLLGAYVRVTLEGRMLRDVVRVPRSCLRQDDRVWIRDAEGKLVIRPVEIVSRGVEDVLVASGISAGEEIITSSLPYVVEGMPLRVLEARDTARTDGRSE